MYVHCGLDIIKEDIMPAVSSNESGPYNSADHARFLTKWDRSKTGPSTGLAFHPSSCLSIPIHGPLKGKCLINKQLLVQVEEQFGHPSSACATEQYSFKIAFFLSFQPSVCPGVTGILLLL